MNTHSLRIAALIPCIVLFGADWSPAQVLAPIRKPVPVSPTTRPPEALTSAVSFTPQSVVLEGGAERTAVKVTSTVKLSNVSLQVVKDGRPAVGVIATTGRDWPASSTIYLRAEGSAIVAEGYQLKVKGVVGTQQTVEAVIPKNKLTIAVVPMGVKLTRIVPSAAERGSVARVEGNGFNALSPLTVYFSGSPNNVQNQSATILDHTNTSITLKVPPIANTGKIKLILGVGATFISVVSDFDFTVIQKPVIESFQPTGGAPGTIVEVQGYNFISPVFKFSNDLTAFCSASGLHVQYTERGQVVKARITVPNGAVTGPIKVLTPEGTAISSQSFQVITTLTVAPNITQFTPGSGSVGALVTISGRNFGQDPQGVAVAFGLQPTGVNPSSCSDETIQLAVPSNATTGKITVTTSAGWAKTAATFYLPPTISNVSPASGPAGYRVYVYGTNFDLATMSANIVKFNGTAAKVISASMWTPSPGTMLTVEVPDRAISGPITVETPGGKATSPQSFTIVQ